jgi:hypothetical protein
MTMHKHIVYQDRFLVLSLIHHRCKREPDLDNRAIRGEGIATLKCIKISFWEMQLILIINGLSRWNIVLLVTMNRQEQEDLDYYSPANKDQFKAVSGSTFHTPTTKRK